MPTGRRSVKTIFEKRKGRVAIRRVLFLLALLATSAVLGQEPAKTPPEKTAPPAPASPNADKAEPETFQRKNPTVEAILATAPNTPARQIRAALIVADLGEAKLAKDFLKKAIDAQLDDAGLVALGDELGSPTFAKLAVRQDLAPEGKTLADAVLGAMAKLGKASPRVAELIGRLADKSARVRDQAIADLVEVGEPVIEPMIDVLADAKQSESHAAARTVLAQLGSAAARPLSAWLDSPDVDLVEQLILAMSESGSRDATIYLLAPYAAPKSNPRVRVAAETALRKLVGVLPARKEAAGILSRRADEYLAGRRDFGGDESRDVLIWQWDPTVKRAVGRTVPPDTASAILAARLAQDAMDLVPEDREIRRLCLLALLQKAAFESGLDRPLRTGPGTAADQAAQFGVADLESVLDEAMASEHSPAAAAAARLLGKVGKVETVLEGRGRPGPLAKAVWSSDRRVQFAAVEAIMRLQPQRAFPGSSQVPVAMGFLATGAGVRKALVAAPTRAEAQQVAGLIIPLGYDVDVAVTGQDAMAKLLASSDYEFVMADALIDRPPLAMLVQQIRRDSRTGSLPVGILMTDETRNQARRVAQADSLSDAFSRPRDEQAIRWQIDRLSTLAGSRPDAAQRRRQAAQALTWLAELGEKDGPVFHFRQAESSALAAVFVPGLGEKAVAVLETMGTPDSQTALVDLASRRTQPIALRQAAAAAFARTVKKHRVLLTSDQIVRQYDRYNQSEKADPATQKVLGSILDTLEGK